MDQQQSSPERDAEEKRKRANAELAEKWLKAIDSRRGVEKKWRTEQGPAVTARYRDDRGAADCGSRFNIFWANTETLKPTIFARMPIPDVRRRYATRDPAARTAALILERSVAYCVEASDTEDVLDRVVEDYLLPGRAELVVRYKPTIDAYEERLDVEPLPDSSVDGERASDELQEPRYPDGTLFDDKGAYRMERKEEVIYHEVYPDYVPWNLFVFGQAKTWKKVPWIAIGALLSESEIKKQYKHITAEQMKLIQFTHSERESKDGDRESGHFALFWDVWHKLTRKFMVFADGLTDGPVTVQDDPLKLECFYPAPEPIYSLRTNNTWMPKPEYLLYQDQAIALDEATERLDVLTKALKVRGVSDQSFDNEQVKLSEILKQPDLTIIPIAGFRGLMEKGGLKSILDTLPLEEIQRAMSELRVRIQELKQVIYEVTGISDIVRGSTVAAETLGAQQLKAQYSGLRVRKRQERFGRFCAETFRIMAEIIAEHFDPETLKIMSGITVIPDALFEQTKAQGQLPAGTVSEAEFSQAIQILRSDKLRGFKVAIEADSTIPADKEQEQKQRTEFIGTVAQYLQQAMPAVQQGLIPAAIAREGLLFAVRAFKVGSEFEEVLEQIGQGEDESALKQKMQQLQQQLQQGAQELQKLQQENVQLKSKQAVDMETARTDAQVKQFEAMVDSRIETMKAQHEMQLDTMKAQHEQQLAVMNSRFTALESLRQPLYQPPRGRRP